MDSPEQACFTPKVNIPQRIKNILKAFLIYRLYHFVKKIYQVNHPLDQRHDDYSKQENYSMDNKLIQFIINEILVTGEYSLEGIARYTRIPFDVIYDAASGINPKISVTSWIQIINLYLQVKPQLAALFTEKLVEIKDQDDEALLALLEEIK